MINIKYIQVFAYRICYNLINALTKLDFFGR